MPAALILICSNSLGFSENLVIFLFVVYWDGSMTLLSKKVLDALSTIGTAYMIKLLNGI